jgi:hypothetical protein
MENKEIQIVYIKNSPAQKKANKRYYEQNKEKISQQKKEKYLQKKQDENYMNHLRQQSKDNYQKRKLKKSE